MLLHPEIPSKTPKSGIVRLATFLPWDFRSRAWDLREQASEYWSPVQSLGSGKSTHSAERSYNPGKQFALSLPSVSSPFQMTATWLCKLYSIKWILQCLDRREIPLREETSWRSYWYIRSLRKLTVQDCFGWPDVLRKLAQKVNRHSFCLSGSTNRGWMDKTWNCGH